MLEHQNNENEIVIETIELIQTDENNVPFGKIIIRVIWNAVTMAASYTLSFSTIAISVLVPRVGDQNNVKQYIAAVPLINTFMTSVTLITSSTLYSISLEAGKLSGMLRKLEASNASEPELEEIRNEIRKVFRYGIVWSSLILPFGFSALFFSESILINVFRQNPEVAKLAAEYLSLFAFAMPGFLLRMVAEQMLFAYGKTTPAMIIALFNFAISTVIAAVLGFRKGITGVATGYVIDAFLTAIGFLLFIALHKDYRKLNLFSLKNYFQGLMKTFKELLKIGLPITLQLSVELLINQLLVSFAGLLGEDSLVVQSFLSLLSLITVIFQIAFGQSISQETSRAIGEGNLAYASRFARTGWITTLAFIGVTVITPIVFFPLTLVRLMTDKPIDAAITKIVKQVIPIAAFTALASAGNYGAVQIQRAAGKKVGPTLTYITGLAISLLMAYLLSLTAGFGMLGLQSGSLSGEFLILLFLLPMMLRSTSIDHLSQIKVTATEQPIIISSDSIDIPQEDDTPLEIIESTQPTRSFFSYIGNCCKDVFFKPQNSETRPLNLNQPLKITESENEHQLSFSFNSKN